MARKKFPEAACLTPGCTGKFGGERVNKGGRGLCHSCHQSAILMIKKGKTSWEELVKHGLAQLAYTSMFEKALIEARKNHPQP